MRFPSPLIPATLVRRYKRFLADVVLPSGEEITAHVANPGAMLGVSTPGSRVWLSKSGDPKRKLPYTWELIEADFGAGPELVGVSTATPNRVAQESLLAALVPECVGYPSLRREVKYGRASRVDFLLECSTRGRCYVECKNVHMMRRPGLAEFPDCVTTRGARHMQELADMVAAGARAVVLFVIQIGSATALAPAADIDPGYARALRSARASGVEVLAYTCEVSTEGIKLARPVPILGRHLRGAFRQPAERAAAGPGMTRVSRASPDLRLSPCRIHCGAKDLMMTYVEASTAPLRKNGQIKLYGESGFAGMRKAGRLAAECLDMLVDEVRPGVPTDRIDKLVFEFGMDHGAFPATLGYRGYRKSTCTSINHVVCHGIPNEKPLREGDIVNIDVTLILDGWHGDSSRMYAVGEVPRRAERLIEVTYEAMMRGIAAVRPGGTTGDIGAAIQAYVEPQHMSVVRDFCGHGLGKLFHDEPNIVHVGRPAEGIVLKPGMLFTVEPMINLGRPHVKVLSDGWTAVTRDRSLSAQFEHTVGVTETGVEIFTLSPKGLDKPPYRGSH